MGKCCSLDFMNDEDLNRLTNAGLKALVRKLMTDEPKKEEMEDEAEESSNPLADLHEEKHGKSPSVAVPEKKAHSGKYPDPPGVKKNGKE